MELGITGHLTRGDEVIKILESLGGNNCYNLTGIYDNKFYYIRKKFKNITNSYIGPDEIKGYKIFSLEYFLEKFPYKVGDKVNIYVQNDDIEGWFDIEVAEITSMRWDPTRCRIVYKMKDINREFCVEDIKDKVDDKTTKDMEEKKINQMSLANCDLDEVEIVLGDRFELKIIDGKYYAVRKKPTYPTTYVDCCKVIGCRAIIGFTGLDDEEEKLYGNFIVLKRCRDAYWKIAGEQMGLGKPWKPVWDESEDLYTIHTFNGEIRLSGTAHRNAILVFPTVEMRDAFYENFKDLIEKCKELL